MIRGEEWHPEVCVCVVRARNAIHFAVESTSLATRPSRQSSPGKTVPHFFTAGTGARSAIMAMMAVAVQKVLPVMQCEPAQLPSRF